MKSSGQGPLKFSRATREGRAKLGTQIVLNRRSLNRSTLYTKSEFWLNSPAQVLMKLGVMLWILPFAFIWTRYAANTGWSPVSQLGTTSLLVYWVHIELVYGR